MHQPTADAEVVEEVRRIVEVERLCARAHASGQAALDRLVNLAARVTGDSSAVIVMRGSTLVPIAFSESEAGGRVIATDHSLQQALHERVLATGAPVAVDAVSKSGTHFDGAHADGVLAAYLGVPLLTSSGTALGVLAVQSAGPRHWSDDDRANLVDLAVLTADALETIDLRHGAADTDRRFADLVNGLDAIVWESDVNAEFFSFISRHAETLLGYPVARWLDVADTWKHLIHPDDRERVVALCSAAVQTCQDHAFDYRVNAADGRVVWLHDRVFVEHQNGVPQRLRGIMVDITATKEAELIVRESEARLAALVAHAADLVGILNADLTVRWVSPAVELLLGAGVDDVIGTSTLMWIHADDVAETTAVFQRVTRVPGQVDHLTYRVQNVQGQSRWVETTVTNLLHDAAVQGIVCNVRDIHAWVLARDEREHREQQLRAIVESSYDIIARFDRHLRYVYVNQAAARITGYESAHFVGKRVHEMSWPTDVAEQLATSLDDVFSTGEARRIEFERDLPAGRLVFSCQLLPERSIDGDVETVLAISRDVTEDRRHADALQHQVFHDHLTGLPNRVLLSERIGAASRAAAATHTPFAVLFIDLDGFKQVNDTWGHAVGDALLSEVAQRLQRSVRPTDTAARLAGDEFGVVFPGIGDAHAALRRAEQLLERLREPIELQGLVATVTPSIGIVMGVAGDSSEDLLRQADTAMYAAKRDGRNRIYLEQPDRTSA